VPIINENDVVANDELRVGDNDTLAAIIANLIEADLLMILTDQEGFFDADPRVNSAAKLLGLASVSDPSLDLAAGGSSGALGRGGMQTKLTAARMAARSGAATMIVPGLRSRVILDSIEGSAVGTLLVPDEAPVSARKRWLSAQLDVKGGLVLDTGAVAALKKSGVSLLSIGVLAVSGEFNRGDLVACVTKDGRALARGLVNYSSADVEVIKRRNSSEIEALLGFVAEPELMHRDNLVLL